MANKSSKKKTSKRVKPTGPAATAVLWGLDPSSKKGAAVRQVLKEMDVIVRTVAPERLGDPAGAFARMVGFRPSPVPYEGDQPDCEFVLLCNFTSRQVDQFIQASREADCVVGPKAMLTQQNRSWPLVRLIEAVAAEHEANAGA